MDGIFAWYSLAPFKYYESKGIFRDYKIQSVEDQQKLAVPMTRETETLFYNIRMIIDTKVETEPRTWIISKVNRISPKGICNITLAQDVFDQHKDYIERDVDGNIIGKWASYFNEILVRDTPETQDESSVISSSIMCSGKRQIKIGGSFKTFTVTFDNQDNLDQLSDNVFSFYIDDVQLDDSLLEIVKVDDFSVKVKFLGNDNYIGKILKVENSTSDGLVTSYLDVEIVPL